MHIYVHLYVCAFRIVYRQDFALYKYFNYYL